MRRSHWVWEVRPHPQANETTDNEILKIAKTDNRIIITKDADFLDSHLLKNEPEKLLFVKTGNSTNRVLLDRFRMLIDKLEFYFQKSNLILNSTNKCNF